MDHSINYNISATSWEAASVPFLLDVRDYLDENWTLSITAAILYVILIFGGRRLMESRERFQLTNELVAWNGMLAIFSILGTVRMLPNLHYAITHQSFHESVCTIRWTELPVIQVWSILFTLSKIIELGDTAFIVLRKQPLILLHWYHHITVLIYTWFSFIERTSSGRWYIGMNYSVHSAMYTYYAVRALKYRPPEWLKMFITLFQLSQMVVGVYIAVYVYQLKQAGVACGVSTRNMRLSFLMYFSYFLLFAKFFYEAYIKAKPVRQTKSNGISNGTHATKNGHVSNGHMVSNGHHESNGYYTRSKKLK